MKKIILRSASVVLALATLFTIAMLFAGCDDYNRSIGSIGTYEIENNYDIRVHIYKHDKNGSLYCSVVYHPMDKWYSSDRKTIESNATQIAKIKLEDSTSHSYPYYITLTLISGKWGEKGSKIQADVYKFTGTGYRWLKNYYGMPFYPI